MTHRDDKEFPRGRRKHRRVEAREVTATVRAGGKAYNYSVVNLSEGGLLVTGDHAPPRGPTLEIELRRPGMAPIGLNGLFAHEDASHRVGLVFAAPSVRAAAAVEKLIAAVEATGGAPPPLPGLRANTGESSAAALAPPVDDPFGQGADPRPPRAGSLDERNEYLRVLVKKRDEALQHGRGLYAKATAEAAELRDTVANLEAKLMGSLTQARAAETGLSAERRTSDELGRTLKAERKAAAEALDEETKRTLESMGTVTALKAKLKKLEAELAQTRADAAATLKATTAQLEAELSDQRAVADAALKAKTDELEAELSKTRGDAAAKLKGKTRQFEVEFAESRTQAEAALKAKTKQFEGELASARRDAEKAARDAQELRAQVAAHAKAIAAQAELDKERAGRREALESLAEVRDARDAAEAELEKIGGELGRLKAKLEAAESALGPPASRRRAEAASRRPGVR